MNQIQRLFKNAVALGTSALAYRVGLAALEIVIARSLDPAAYGAFATATGFASLSLVVVDHGVSLGLIRAIAHRDRLAGAYFGNSLLVRGGLALIVYPIMVGTAWLTYPPATVTLIALMGLFVIFASFQELLASLYQALGRMEWIAFFRIVVIAALGAAVLAGLARGAPVLWLALPYPLVAVAGFAVWFAFATRRLRPSWDRVNRRQVMHETLVFGLTAIFWTLTFRLTVVVLSLFRSEEEVGTFAAAYRIVEVTSKLPVLLSMLLIPLMFRTARESPQRLDRIYRANIRLIGVCILPIAAAIGLFAQEIVASLYGSGYERSVPLLAVLAWSLPFAFLTVALGDTLTARDLQVRRTWIQGGVVAAGAAAHVILAAAWGGMGSAVAFLACQVALCALLVLALRGGVAPLEPLAELAGPAMAVLGSAGMVVMLRSLLPGVVLVPVFFAGYGALALALRAVELEEPFRLAARLLHRRRIR